MKGLTIKLVSVLVAFIVTISVYGYDREIDGMYYNLDRKLMTAEVTYKKFYGGNSYKSDYSGVVSIPREILIEGESYFVTSIGEHAFDGCEELTDVTIPSSVTSIGISAFFNCHNLREIHCANPIPPTCSGKSTFECSASTVRDVYDVYNYVSLHVPMGSKEAYSSAYDWWYFNKIKEDANVDGTIYYTRLKIKQPNGGYTEQYVKADEEYTIYFGGEARARINTIMLDNVDVTDQLVDGFFTVPALKAEGAEISISYETDPTGISAVDDAKLKVYGSGGKLFVRGAGKSASVVIYTVEGKSVSEWTIDNEHVFSLQPAIYIVKVNDRSFKVSL